MRKFPAASFIVILTLAFATVLPSCNDPQPRADKEASETIDVLKALSASQGDYLTTEGFTDYYEKPVPLFFMPGGLLEKGEITLKPGTTFKKGQLLFQVDNSKAYSKLRAYLRELNLALEPFISETEQSIPQQSGRWKAFAAAINPAQLLPPLPEIRAEERNLAHFKQVDRAYAQAKEAEIAMAGYFYVAPFDGMVLETFVKPGSQVEPGETVATLASSRKYFARIFVQPGAEAAVFQSAAHPVTLYDRNGKKLGTGKLQQTQTTGGQLVIGYVVTPEKGVALSKNQVVNVRSGEKRTATVKLPVTAVRGDSVSIADNRGNIRNSAVTIAGRENDSIHVSGLKSGAYVLVHYREHAARGKKIRIVN